MRCGSEEGQGFGSGGGRVQCYEGGRFLENIAQARIFFLVFKFCIVALVIQNPAGTDLPNTNTVQLVWLFCSFEICLWKEAIPLNLRSISGCCYTKAGLPKLRWNSILYHNFFMPYDWVFPSEELIILKVTYTWIRALEGTQRFSLLVSLSPVPKRQTWLTCLSKTGVTGLGPQFRSLLSAQGLLLCPHTYDLL